MTEKNTTTKEFDPDQVANSLISAIAEGHTDDRICADLMRTHGISSSKAESWIAVARNAGPQTLKVAVAEQNQQAAQSADTPDRSPIRTSEDLVAAVVEDLGIANPDRLQERVEKEIVDELGLMDPPDTDPDYPCQVEGTRRIDTVFNSDERADACDFAYYLEDYGIANVIVGPKTNDQHSGPHGYQVRVTHRDDFENARIFKHGFYYGIQSYLNTPRRDPEPSDDNLEWTLALKNLVDDFGDKFQEHATRIANSINTPPADSILKEAGLTPGEQPSVEFVMAPIHPLVEATLKVADAIDTIQGQQAQHFKITTKQIDRLISALSNTGESIRQEISDSANMVGNKMTTMTL